MQNKGFVGIIIAQTLSQLFFTKSADLLSADSGIFKKIYITSSEANRVPIPRESPSPSPKFGDRVGTGKVCLDSSGKIRGLGELNPRGFLGINSPKIPKV